MLLTLFGISVIIFMLLRLTPGNIADILFDAGGFVDPADKARIEADLGLDKPMPVQYATVDRRPAAGRSRHVLPDRAAGDPRDRAAHPDHRQARRPGAVLRGADRGAARRHQRGQAEHAARLHLARDQPVRAVDAGILAGLADPDGVRRLFRHDPDLHRRADQLLARAGDVQRAGGGGRLSQLGAADAADPLVDARGAAAGLYPHRALEGRLRERRSIITTR